MKISDIIDYLESRVPLALQEPYDNAGLHVGDRSAEVDKVLITLEVTAGVLAEARRLGCGLIISHHPLVFTPLKQVTGSDEVQRLLIEAIKSDIALYAMHTNLDSVAGGVSAALASRLGLQNQEILAPVKGLLRKLVVFCPAAHAEALRQAIFSAGAGHIGNYDCCSFSAEGRGSFRAGEGAHPFAGAIGQLHHEKETRVESIFPAYLQSAILKAARAAHPYEEMAFDIYPLENEHSGIGMGIIGDLPEEKEETAFLDALKTITAARVLRHSPLTGKKVKRVAVCGGAGASFIKQAIRAGADVFVTGDLKYHDFFLAENRLVLADIGHYESEQFAKELIYSILSEKFPNFAALVSEVNTNPVNCL